MKTFINNNSEALIFGAIALAFIGVVTFNIITYGICDTSSFQF